MSQNTDETAIADRIYPPIEYEVEFTDLGPGRTPGTRRIGWTRGGLTESADVRMTDGGGGEIVGPIETTWDVA